MNKGFIFDWSGTLSDNFPKVHEVCGLMFRELGREPLTKEEMRMNFTVPYMKFWNKYFPDVSKERQDELYKKYIHQGESPKLYGGAPEAVKYLHEAGYKIFVVSSDWLSTLLPEVKNSGLENFFTEVIGGVYDKRDVFLTISKKHILDKSKTFYIGDTDGDIGYGKAANIKTIGISWGFQHRDVLSKANPDFLIDHILELKKIL